MALIKLGPIVSAITGTIGGVNFTTSTKRPTARNARRRPSQNSAHQVPPRARMKYLFTQWLTLTQAQRAAWGTTGTAIRRADRLGQVRALSGREFFFSHNLLLLQTGQTLDLAIPPLPYDAGFLTTPVLAITGASAATFTPGAGIGPAFFGISVFAQTFFRPVPQYLAALSGVEIGGLPQKWIFVRWVLMAGGTPYNLYPYLDLITGPMRVGQVLAVQGRFAQTGYYSTWKSSTTAAR